MAGYGSDDTLAGDDQATGGYGKNDRPSGLDIGATPAAPGFIPTIKRTGGQMLTSGARVLEDIAGPNAVSTGVRGIGQGIIDRNPAGINSLGDVLESPWLTVKEAVGQMVPQIGAGIAGAKAGAAAGGRIAGPRGAAVGSIVGGLAPIFGQEYGGIRDEQIEGGQESIPRALGAAGVATGLELLGPEGRIIYKGLKNPVTQTGKQIAKQAGKDFLVEGATEAAQTGVEKVGAFQEPFSAPNLEEAALAGVMGGIGGGIVGGAHAGLKSMVAPVETAPAPSDIAALPQPPGSPPNAPPNAPPNGASIPPDIAQDAPTIAQAMPGDAIRAGALPEVGPLTRGINALVNAEATAADAGQPIEAPVSAALAGIQPGDEAPQVKPAAPTSEAGKINTLPDGRPEPPAEEAPPPDRKPIFDPARGQFARGARPELATLESVQAYIKRWKVDGAVPVQTAGGKFSYLKPGEPGHLEAMANPPVPEEAPAAKKTSKLQEKRAAAKLKKENAAPTIAPAPPVEDSARVSDSGGRTAGGLTTDAAASTTTLKANDREYRVGDSVAVHYPPDKRTSTPFDKTGKIVAINGNKVTFKPNGGKIIVIGPDRLGVNLSAAISTKPKKAKNPEPVAPAPSSAAETPPKGADHGNQEEGQGLLKSNGEAPAEVPESDLAAKRPVASPPEKSTLRQRRERAIAERKAQQQTSQGESDGKQETATRPDADATRPADAGRSGEDGRIETGTKGAKEEVAPVDAAAHQAATSPTNDTPPAKTLRERRMEALAAGRAAKPKRVEPQPIKADTRQEATDDSATPATSPAVDQPLAERAQERPVRGAVAESDGTGRADDGGVRAPGGRPEGADDARQDVGHGAGADAVPDRPTEPVASGRERVPSDDYRPAPGDLTRTGSWFATAARNVDIIELALAIEKEGRPATPAEQAQLAKYVGFGASEIRNALFPVPGEYARKQEPKRLIWPDLVREARWKPLAERLDALPRDWQRSILQSTQYAHYTSENIIRSVWSAVQRMGFTGGKIFEPGGGIGSFPMLMPDSVRQGSKFTGIEFDGPTALIARLLSPSQNMLHDDFIKRKVPRNYFDLAVGNPPFSQTPILGDPDYEKHKFMLHDFFFAKAIDRVRPGGLLAFVTSKGTMDKQSDKARRYLAARADLMGAIRLPSTAFEGNAGTSVVTDVIFLRKRAPGEAAGGHPWKEIKGVTTPDGDVFINEYFAANPQMVLGQNRISGNTDDMGRRINSNGRGGEKYTVVSYDSTPEALDAKFAEAVKNLPENVYSTLKADVETVRAETAKADFDPSIKREGVVYVGKDGTLMRVTEGVGRPLDASVKLSDKDKAWFKAYVGVREAVQQARLAQVQDGNWEKALKALNKVYDEFRAKHGPINDFRVQVRKSTDEDGNEIEVKTRVFKNRRLFREDYDAAVVTQLETITEDGEIVKAQFLKGRTIGKPVSRDVKTVGDALAVSLDETGRFDPKDVGRRIGLPEAEALEALGDQAYQTPQGKWQLADEYLSGDVVTKLAEAQEAARDNPALERNVAALKAAQPEKLGPSQISAKLGGSWIPAEYVNEFAAEIGAGLVTFDPKTESWQVAGGNERTQRKAGAEYGTAARSPSELLEAVLNSRSISVKYGSSAGKDLAGKTDPTATTAANEAARKIKDKFKSWVWTDSERAATLVERYNERFNNIAGRKFDGSHLTLPGVSLRFKLHPHQLRAIWRQVQTGDTYLAHAVGAGKTIEMIAGGMEQKRLGLIKKPIYVVPNHMLEQFANEFMELYPLANIMVADDENFSAERRRAFVAAATLNAPDAIVITHSAFERIGVKEESVAPLRDQIIGDLQDELDGADKTDRVRRSQLEQQIEAVTQRFDRIVGAGGKDSTIKFEDMGVDMIYADEAHVFRKLDFSTNQKVKGIDPNGSKRSLDMYVKTRYLEGLRPGRAMVFASGTPVTNTMGELHTIMRFFAPEQLDRDGISTFDAWSRQFGEVASALEANAAGKYETVERFSKFDNVPELMSRVRQFMDVLTSESLGALVQRPTIEGGKPNLITIEPTPALKSYMENVLAPRVEKSRRWKQSPQEPNNPDPMVAIITDGRFAALDPRFFGAKVDEKTDTPLKRLGAEIIKEYKATAKNEYVDQDGKVEPIKGGTQIVFYNLGFGEGSMKNRGFNARDALTKQLTAGGVKREHIAWFDEADTDAKKEAIFKAMRAGQLRVLIGSAKKMGTGVNVQKRLTALQYFDPPWYPADVEQPHGRILRQGNQNKTVRINWFASKGSYASTMWQMVGRKQRFIDQAYSGDKSVRSMDDMSEASQYEQAAAVSSGDPRALQLAGLRQDVERFERLQKAHASEQIAVRDGLRSAGYQVDNLGKRLATYEKAFKAIGSSYFQFSDGKVNGVTYSKQTEFGQALKDRFNKLAADSVLEPFKANRPLGKMGPIELSMEALTSYDTETKAHVPNGRFQILATIGGYDFEITSDAGLGADVDALGLVRKVVNAANSLDGMIRRTRDELNAQENDVERLKRKLGAPFEHQQELAEKYGELKALEEELRLEGLATKPAQSVKEQDNTNLRQTGTPQANAADVVFSLADQTAPAQTLDRGEQPTASLADRHAAAALNKLIAKFWPDLVLEPVPAKAAGKGRDALSELAKRAFGKQVTWFRANRPFANGLVDPYQRDRVFLNVQHDKPQIAILGHELLHHMKRDAPDAYRMLHARVMALSDGLDQRHLLLQLKREKVGAGAIGREELEEEFVADLVGDNFMDPKFWESLAKDQPSGFRAVLNAILRWIDDVLSRLSAKRPFGTDAYITDWKAARAAVVEGMREFMQANGAAEPAPAGGPEQPGFDITPAMREHAASGLPLFSLADTLQSGLNNAKDVKLPAGYVLGDLFNSNGRLNWWHKTVGTMHNLAQRSPAFKRVYDATQDFLNDTSYYATEAANLAPTILPKLETWRDITKMPLSAADTKAIAAPIFEGTLTWARDERGSPVRLADLEADAAGIAPEDKAREMLRRGMISEQVLKMWQGLPIEQYEAMVETRYANQVLRAGVVWNDAELRSMFKLNDEQIKQYREFRAAIDKSLTNLGISDMVRFAGKDVDEATRARALDAQDIDKAAIILRDHLFEAAMEDQDRADVLNSSGNTMIAKADRVKDLIARGYAPLSRFGQYTLDVVDEDGQRAYFGMFETAAERAKMARQMRDQFQRARITQGTVSQEAYRLFAGVSPETLELFGEMLGLESQGDDAGSKAFQEYLKVARSNRSALKRLIERKGIAGFSEDAGRVLAGFIYSNARQNSGNLHMGEVTEAVDAIPQTQGQLKDHAVRLAEYVKNPQEEAQGLRSLLFAQYLGGSIASAMVNMLQPVQVTLPYLSQFGGVTAAARQMMAAVKDAHRRFTGDKELDAALRKAAEEGIVSPQEVHQLMAQATGGVLARSAGPLSKVMFAWGKVFGVAEQFNRRVTFIAAYRTAVAQGREDPAKFAERAVAETQFVYNKANRPRWARGAVGSTIFAFKQYSISYLELLNRMWTQGGADGKRATALALGILFLAAGFGGMPGADDLDDLIDGFLQNVMGLNFSSKRAKREFFAETLGLGTEASRFLEHGLSGLPGIPIDVSGRLGLGNLVPGTGLLTRKQDHTSDVVEFVGPAGDLARRAFQAGGKAAAGEVGEALKLLSPVAAQNVIMAADMATTGTYKDRAGKKVIDVDAYDSLMKGIGFQPSSVARVQEANRTAEQMKALNRMREAEIADQWAKGLVEKDTDAVTAAREALRDWNRANPESPIRIVPAQIQKRVQSMTMDKATRIQKTAPKEIRAQVHRELQLDVR